MGRTIPLKLLTLISLIPDRISTFEVAIRKGSHNEAHKPREGGSRVSVAMMVCGLMSSLETIQQRNNV